MSTWTEIDIGSDRCRYKERGIGRALGHRYIVEYWHKGRSEWRELRNGSSRDWFAMGVQAGLEMAREVVQEELPI